MPVSKTLKDPSEIRLCLNKPDPSRPGTSYVVTDRLVTFDEFRMQVRRTLKSIKVAGWECDAYENSESFYSASDIQAKYAEAVVEQGKLLVVPHYGHCEGYGITFYFLGDDGRHENWLHIKYLANQDEVWLIAQKLADAVNEGAFN